MKQIYKYCYGITSKTNTQQVYDHVFMMDFDGVNLKTVTEYLSSLQQQHDIGTIYIIKTKNGYNAIGLDKLPLVFIYQWGQTCYSPCDRVFLKLGLERNKFILRFGSDKKLVSELRNDSHKYEKSLAHKKFLEWFFDIDIDNCYPVDGNTMLEIVRYHSDKHGYHIMRKDYGKEEK